MNARLKKALALVPGALTVNRLLKRAKLKYGRGVSVRVTRPRERGAPPIADEQALQAAYEASGLSDTPDDFVLYRIVGNDLVPRHAKGQSRENLRFILENEPDLEACEKRFVLNRIVDPAEEAAIVALLESHGRSYLRLPFDADRYRTARWDITGVPPKFAPHGETFARLRPVERERILMRLYRHKNNAVMHNNGARNAALDDGRNAAKWVLPFDGNCFFTADAWMRLREDIGAAASKPYHIVPMARILDNASLLAPNAAPPADEEPQIAFRADARERFDEAYPYGRRPKVELLWRLGVPGLWDDWPIEPWDHALPPFAEEAGQYATSGWVARLYSGQNHLEDKTSSNTLVTRGGARTEAVVGLIDQLDETLLGRSRRTLVLDASPSADDRGSDPASLDAALADAADEALSRGPFAVTFKTSLPPSGDCHDYWHPAPYFWPHPLRLPGLAHVQRDGKRVPGTQLYEPFSERFDRTSLQRLFDDTFTLALADRQLGDVRYSDHAARLVRTWFLDPETRMNPSLTYAQVRRGHNANRGASSGIIEMKDLYFFLDAVAHLVGAGALSESERAGFDAWLRAYLDWLRTSPQGIGERAAANNHGTYYDLQIGAIALFLGEDRLVRHTLRDSRMRMLTQFAADGRQPEELTRTTTAHYCAFNLQGWLHLAELADAVGEDLWAFEGDEGQSLARACEWFLAFAGKEWPFEQIDAFDPDRFVPIHEAYAKRYARPANSSFRPDPLATKPIFFPHDGVRPFWQIR